MSDGFSQPDPAPVDDDGGFVVEEGALLDMIDDSVSCENCSHYPVCAIINGIRPMFQNWQAGGEDDPIPVEPENLALICREFDPVETGT